MSYQVGIPPFLQPSPYMPTIIEGREHTTGGISEECGNYDGAAGPEYALEEGAFKTDAEHKQQREGNVQPTRQMSTRTQTADARNL